MGGECGTHRKLTHVDFLVRKPERSGHFGRCRSKVEDKRILTLILLTWRKW